MPGDNTMNGKPQLQDFKTTSQKQHTNEKKTLSNLSIDWNPLSQQHSTKTVKVDRVSQLNPI